jgi:predicted DNA-binding transcriptional regulator YafY
MTERNKQVLRLLRVAQILEHSRLGLTALEITSRLHDMGLQCTKRTVYRDIEALEASGFALERGKRELVETFRLDGSNAHLGKHLVIPPSALMSLYMAKGILEPLKESPFYEGLQVIFSELESKLGPRLAADLKAWADEIKFEPGPRWSLGLSRDVLDTLHAACSDREIVEAEYRSAHSQTVSVRRLGPQGLYFSKGAFYFVAEDLADKKIKTFSVARFNFARKTDEPFEGEVVDVAQLMNTSFGVFKGERPERIRVYFNKNVSGFVKERRWHASEKISDRGDGAIEYELNVAVTPDLVQWILGFGGNALVVEPRSLVLELKLEAQKVLDQYIGFPSILKAQ